jgi:hypothetical protein
VDVENSVPEVHKLVPKVIFLVTKISDSSKKILASWATGPKAASANQKDAVYKRPKIK